MSTWISEVELGERFSFGRNWRKFLLTVDESRIAFSEQALREMLETDDLRGKSFVDIGSGSGLSSLAAIRLGARLVRSIDIDPESLACTRELIQLYCGDRRNWMAEQGSALDEQFLRTLGTFDIVHSWGVLHHTGDMWLALERVTKLVAPGGKVFIAIYNDEGDISRLWKLVKKSYNRGIVWRSLISWFYTAWLALKGAVIDVLWRHKSPLTRYREYRRSRGMSFRRDVADWLGGYPYEVAKPEAIFEFFKNRGFTLVKLKTVGRGFGNNEFVFSKCAG